jgi:hypothetical protein
VLHLGGIGLETPDFLSPAEVSPRFRMQGFGLNSPPGNLSIRA